MKRAVRAGILLTVALSFLASSMPAGTAAPAQVAVRGVREGVATSIEMSIPRIPIPKPPKPPIPRPGPIDDLPLPWPVPKPGVGDDLPTPGRGPISDVPVPPAQSVDDIVAILRFEVHVTLDSMSKSPLLGLSPERQRQIYGHGQRAVCRYFEIQELYGVIEDSLAVIDQAIRETGDGSPYWELSLIGMDYFDSSVRGSVESVWDEYMENGWDAAVIETFKETSCRD